MSGSESRNRTKLMGVRLLPEEHERIREAAADRGVTMSELVIDLLRSSAPELIGTAHGPRRPSARYSPRRRLAS